MPKRVAPKMKRMPKPRRKMMSEEEGEGIITEGYKFLTGNYPGEKTLKKLLNEHGDAKVTSMYVGRDKVGSAIETVLNLVAAGKFKDAKSKAGYDKLFHLFCEISLSDGYSFRIEKNEKFTIGNPQRKSNTETMNVSVNKPVSLAMFMNNAIKSAGDKNFFTYSAFQYNCQDFIKNLLKSNGMLTSALDKFIFQDVSLIQDQIPKFTSKVANTVTDFAATVKSLFTGGGIIEDIEADVTLSPAQKNKKMNSLETRKKIKEEIEEENKKRYGPEYKGEERWSKAHTEAQRGLGVPSVVALAPMEHETVNKKDTYDNAIGLMKQGEKVPLKKRKSPKKTNYAISLQELKQGDMKADLGMKKSHGENKKSMESKVYAEMKAKDTPKSEVKALIDKIKHRRSGMMGSGIIEDIVGELVPEKAAPIVSNVLPLLAQLKNPGMNAETRGNIMELIRKAQMHLPKILGPSVKKLETGGVLTHKHAEHLLKWISRMHGKGLYAGGLYLPGEKPGASSSNAGLKAVMDENRALKKRIAELEKKGEGLSW